MKKQNLIAILGLFALFIVAFSSGRVIAPANAQGVVGSVYIMSNSARAIKSSYTTEQQTAL
jgi:hypothetical protein